MDGLGGVGYTLLRILCGAAFSRFHPWKSCEGSTNQRPKTLNPSFLLSAASTSGAPSSLYPSTESLTSPLSSPDFKSCWTGAEYLTRPLLPAR